jgi:hypothetical protein
MQGNEHVPASLDEAGLDNRATLLLGHTRWRTRGDERVNSNNHPIRAGEVIGTHNGTIYNADYLFRRWKLRRFAEVDSKILFRLAANAARDGAMDIERFKARLRRCRGQITAVIACRTDPGTVLVLKGNRPLELRWHPRRKAVLYASDPAYLDAVLAEEKGWRGSIPAAPASTAAFWSRSRPTEPFFRPGSMWVKTRSRAGSRPSCAPAGPDSLDSVTLGQIRKITGQTA